MVDRAGAAAGGFLAVCLGLGPWEARRLRRGDARRGGTWPVNLSLAVVNSVVVRCSRRRPGSRSRCWPRVTASACSAAWPAAVEFVLAVLVLDAVYLQHRLFHVVPLLWKLHRLHHADRGFDFTTGVRFYPGEIALSTVTGAPASSRWGVPGGHAGVRDRPRHRVAVLPRQRAADRRSLRRLVFVTPDMHRVHHSTDGVGENTNFGFSFSWWDRLRGTYRLSP